MLTEAEYNELLPHREDIMQFEKTQKFKGNSLHIIDRIRQRINPLIGPICFSCSGSKANALLDAINLIKQYEENNK